MGRAIAVLLVLLGLGTSLAAVMATGTSPFKEAISAEEETMPIPKGPEFYQLAPLTFPVIDEKGATQQISLLVSLELDDATMDDVRAIQPRLFDAYIQDMYGLLGSGEGLMHGNVVDVAKIKDRLTTITKRVMGKDMIKTVLLQVVQQRPI